MNDDRLREQMEAAARDAVPDTIDLWPRIRARLQTRRTFVQTLRARPALALLLALLALALLTTGAYAAYRLVLDPGLSFARDSGLVTDVNLTARPSRLPAPPPEMSPAAAVPVGAQQSLGDLTVVLDWIHVGDSQQAFQIRADGLPADVEFDLPVVTYPGVTPEQPAGKFFFVTEENGVLTGLYLSYQIVRQGVRDGRVSASIDLPLVRRDSGVVTPVAVLHFTVPDLPVSQRGVGGGSIYAVRSNGVEMRLEAVTAMPAQAVARLCHEAGWDLQTVSARFSSGPDPLGGEPVSPSQMVVMERNGDFCTDLVFPLAHARDARWFSLKVDRLVNSAGEVRTGNWQFVADVPGIEMLSRERGIAGPAEPPPGAPAPDSKSVGDLTATLLWAYADAYRVDVAVRFEGWREGQGVMNAQLLDSDGREVNSGTGYGSDPAEPSLVRISFNPLDEMRGDRFAGQLLLAVMDFTQPTTPPVEFRFPLDLPVYPAIEALPRGPLTVTAGGIEMQLVSLRMTPAFSRAILCYDKPGPADWMIGSASILRVGPDQTGLADYGLLSDVQIGPLGKGGLPGWTPPAGFDRCVRVGFALGHHGRPETVILHIPELEQSLPEYIPDEKIQAARQALRAQGIEMDWVVFAGQGGGGAGPVITARPEGMDDGEVMRRFYEALGYYHAGPWIFALAFEPQP